MKNKIKTEILTAAVRDICSVSVAPVAKSKVREIVNDALDEYLWETDIGKKAVEGAKKAVKEFPGVFERLKDL